MAAMVAGAAFAADVSASVYMTGSLAAGSDGGNTTILNLTDQDQKDADALQFNYSGEQAGASFRAWYNFSGDDGLSAATDTTTTTTTTTETVEDGDGNHTSTSTSTSTSDSTSDSTSASATTLTANQALRIRSIQLWFKPIDALKITIGNQGQYLYTEQAHWWKTPTGIGAVAASSWNHRWSNYDATEGKGIGITLTPIDGLTIEAAAICNDSFLTLADGVDPEYMGYGATVKYSLGSGSLAAGWRDEGKGSAKILTVGGDFNVAGVYGFVQPRFYFGSKDYTETSWYVNDNTGLTGVAIDNYFKYTTGALTLQGRFPFTVRLTGLDNDPSFLVYEVKAAYAMNGFSPYLSVSNDNGIYEPLCFGSADGYTVGDTFAIDVNPGVTLNVGECSIDVSFEFWMNKKDSAVAYGWQLPFYTRVSF